MPSLFAQPKSSTLDLQLAVVGLPGSGKTSFLSALHGIMSGRTTAGALWTVEADPATRAYLGKAWTRLRDGLTVQPTHTHSVHPELSLVLRREWRGELTHTVSLKCIDTAGEFARSKEQRSGQNWLPVAKRIRAAHVLILVIDAMNILHSQLGDRRSEAQLHGLIDMLFDACQMPGDNLIRLNRKLLAVCFCKCDAVCRVDIDGFDDDRDALILADLLLPPQMRANLKNRVAAIGYFGVSVLRRDRWRWAREPKEMQGACVRVGHHAMEPVGLFEPFEWVSQVARSEP